MSLSAEELQRVVEELQPLVGAVVQKVWVPRERVMLLELRKPGASSLLLLDAEPSLTRLHLVHRRPPSADEALPFQQVARAHLVGRKLTRLAMRAPATGADEGRAQRPGDRVVELDLENAEGARRVVAELTGRHGNLFVLSASGSIICIGGRNVSRLRSLGPGQAWAPPESEPPPAARLAAKPRFEISEGSPSLSEQIERAYGQREDQLQVRNLRANLGRPLAARRARLVRTLSKVRAEADRTREAEVHLRAGELIKQNLGTLRRGQSSATLVDYASGEPQPVEVALRPELSPVENLEAHFRQHRRLRQGAVRAGERLQQLERELAELDQRRERLETMDLEALRAEVSTAPPVRAAKSAGPGEHRPYRELLGWGGRRIWVGKSAADNDELTFRLSRGHDLWLHARGWPGSHVVVPLDRGQAVPQELLLDAAAAAVHYSQAKGEAQAEVVYVPVRLVRRVKGGAPGQVTFSQEKTLRYRVEPERMARLLASQGEG